MTDKEFLTNLESSDKDVRFKAWRAAGEVSAATVPQLAKLIATGTAGVAKAAREAMTTMTHSVGKQESARRDEVVDSLTVVAISGAMVARVHALRSLSFIAGPEVLPRIVPLLKNADLREEAIFCMERIPGNEASLALINVYRDTAQDFKARILYALGHRRAAGAAGIVNDEMRSANPEIAHAAVRAYARIGRRGSAPQWPMAVPEVADNILRFADAQAAQGNGAEALKQYKLVLGRAEEHLQCAAIIGLGKLNTPEASALIHPFLKSGERNVRITAQRVWKAMV